MYQLVKVYRDGEWIETDFMDIRKHETFKLHGRFETSCSDAYLDDETNSWVVDIVKGESE